MTNTCVSVPEDLKTWLTAEARARGSSVSRLLCDIAQREKDSQTMADIDALKKRVADLERQPGILNNQKPKQQHHDQ